MSAVAAAVVIVLLFALLAAVAGAALYRAYAWTRANRAENQLLLKQGGDIDTALEQAQAATFAGSTAKNSLVTSVNVAVTSLKSSLAQLQAVAKATDSAHAAFAQASYSLEPGLVQDAQRLQRDQEHLKNALGSVAKAAAALTGPDSQLQSAQSILQALQARFSAADASLTAAYPTDLVQKVADLLQLQAQVRKIRQQVSDFLASSHKNILAIDQLLGASATTADLTKVGDKIMTAYEQFAASLQGMFGQDVEAGRNAFAAQVEKLSAQLNSIGSLDQLGARQAALAQFRLGSAQQVTLDATTLCLGPSQGTSTCFSKADLQQLATMK